jgi:hypothetical protein
MKIKQIRLFILCVFCIVATNSFSQDEYRAEIGLAGGGNYYIGDANSQLFNNIQLAYGAFFLYRLDQRFALKAEFTRIPKIIGQNNSFVNDTINVGDICLEFNFFDLENNPYKRFSKKFSPFIFAGAGFMTDLYDKQKLPEPCLSFGVGMKIKLAERWNFNAQWSNRLLLFSDNMENNPLFNNTNNLNGNNIFNNDLLSTVTVGISFDFWEKQCKCSNISYLK